MQIRYFLSNLSTDINNIKVFYINQHPSQPYASLSPLELTMISWLNFSTIQTFK